MLERQTPEAAFRPFLKINGCDVCENFEWHANLHVVARYVSRDEFNRLHLVKEEWTENVRMDVTHSVTTRISPGSPAQWDDSYRHQPLYPHVMEGPYTVYKFAEDDGQVAVEFARAFGAELITHEELLAKVAVPGESEQG